MQAANVGMRWTFVLYTVSAACWIANGIRTRNRPLIITNIVLLILDGIAVCRWFS